jgi:hypothetical protein
MDDDDSARRDARRLVLTYGAGDASANSPTPFFGKPFGAAVGALIVPALARKAS